MVRLSSASIVLVGVLACAAQAGGGGFALLRMSPGARMAAMAGAGVASPADASVVFANPGALAVLQGSQVYLAHEEWLQGVDHDLLGAAIVTERHAWAVGLAHLAVGDIELRTMPSVEPLAVVSAHEVAVALSYARQWHERVLVGVAAKYLYSKIYLDTAAGVAVDVGGCYKAPWSGITCGLAVRNVGGTGRLRDADIALPVQVQAGVARAMHFTPWQTELAMLSDVLLERGQRTRLLLGAEGLLRGTVALRVGYAFGYSTRGFSAGVGLRGGRYRVDYSFLPFTDELGTAQQLSLSVGLSKGH